MDVTVTIKGLAELEARLTELDALAGQKLVRRVLRKVAKPMFQRAVAGAQSVGKSMALAASVQIYNKKPKGREVAKVAVGSVAKNRTATFVHNAYYNRKRKGVFYGWMLERGHRVGTRSTGWLQKLTRRNGRGGTAAGQVRGRPWFEPAVRASEGEAISAFVAEMAKAVKRLEKRTGKTPNPDVLVTE